jgi:hypothetical protein
MPQTLERTQSNQAPSENKWSVPPGTSSSPRAKFLYRLRAPQRWWLQSISRIVVQEILAFPHRILAALRIPHLRLGNTLLSSRGNRSMVSPCEVSEFVRACKTDMEKQRTNHPWLTTLDCEVLSQSYRLGVEWAFDTIDRCIEAHNVVLVAPFPSLADPPRAISIDMLKRQWYKSQYESARHRDPSQSD